MSPFATELRNLRFSKGLRQQDVADAVGCERAYVSSLETDLKQAPPAAFVEALCQRLDLPDGERDTLITARLASRRTYSLPSGVPRATYELAHALFGRIERLSALQIQAIRAILELGDGPAVPLHPAEGRVRRSDRIRDAVKEVPM